MPQLAPHIAALSLALHTLLGCCWHHVHADVAEPTLACHEHHCDDHSPVDHDHHQSDCDEGGCVFVKGEQSQSHTPVTAASMPNLPTQPADTYRAVQNFSPDIAWLPFELESHFLCARLRC